MPKHSLYMKVTFRRINKSPINEMIILKTVHEQLGKASYSMKIKNISMTGFRIVDEVFLKSLCVLFFFFCRVAVCRYMSLPYVGYNFVQ